jgi:DNA-binding transcriptional ArsR family regulator
MLDELTKSEEPPAIDAEPKVVTFGSEDTAVVFDALGSETSRGLYRELLAEPRTASELAEAVDTSIQTVSYHLDRLQEANLIEEGATRYSDRGREMVVWVPVSRGILVTDAEERDRLRERVAAVLGLAVGAAVVSAGVRVVARRVVRPSTRLDPASLPADPSTGENLVVWLLTTAGTVDLGIGLFLGGLAVLLAKWRTE